MNFVNNWSQAIDLPAGEDTVAGILGLPDGEYLLTLTNSATAPTRWEIVAATVVSGVATLERAQEGTADQTWPTGSLIYCSLTAGTLLALQADARGIVSTTIDGSGHLIVTYNDGASVDAGYVVGAKGDTGTAGRGITGATVDGSGHLILSYTTGPTSDAGLVVGAAGRGISSTAIDGSGHLIVTYTDATTDDLGKVTGENGTGTGDVVGPSASVDGEVALFSGTTGKLLKRGVFQDLVRATVATAISFATSTAVVAGDTILQALGKLQAQITKYRPQAFAAACSDLTTVIAVGSVKGYLDIPYNFTVTEVYCSLLTPQASGSLVTVDVNANGTSILGTKLTIDNTEVNSKTAAAPPTITTTALLAGDRITFDIDQVGASTVAKGLIGYVVGYPT